MVFNGITVMRFYVTSNDNTRSYSLYKRMVLLQFLHELSRGTPSKKAIVEPHCKMMQSVLHTEEPFSGVAPQREGGVGGVGGSGMVT